MIHLRIVSPPALTDTLLPALRADSSMLNLTVLGGVVSNPDADALDFDVPQGSANQIVERLKAAGVDRQGSIFLDNVDTRTSAYPMPWTRRVTVPVPLSGDER